MGFILTPFPFNQVTYTSELAYRPTSSSTGPWAAVTVKSGAILLPTARWSFGPVHRQPAADGSGDVHIAQLRLDVTNLSIEQDAPLITALLLHSRLSVRVGFAAAGTATAYIQT